MDSKLLLRRYQDLACRLDWREEDVGRTRTLRTRVEPHFASLADDVCRGVERHQAAHGPFPATALDVERLKQALREWLEEIFSGLCDETRVTNLRRIGLGHFEAGLDPASASLSLSLLRSGVLSVACHRDPGEAADLEALASLHKRLDLDLAIILDAYQGQSSSRLRDAERLAGVSQIADAIGHELRQPLNIIRTSAYFLLHDEDPGAEKTVEHLRRIDRQVALADRVITAMSAFAKLPVPEVVPVPVVPALDAALANVSMPPDIEISIDRAESAQSVLADEGQLQIVLGNLLRNARDAMPDGGRVSLTVCDAGEDVEIAVSDTGEGIEPEELRRIMEPLYTTKARGMGLGLAISRAILEKHRGRLRVKSEPGKGATFTVTLPRAGNPAV